MVNGIQLRQHNFSLFAIFLPKMIKIGGNSTEVDKFAQLF